MLMFLAAARGWPGPKVKRTGSKVPSQASASAYCWRYRRGRKQIGTRGQVFQDFRP
jgi:hypothetical protein